MRYSSSPQSYALNHEKDLKGLRSTKHNDILRGILVDQNYIMVA